MFFTLMGQLFKISNGANAPFPMYSHLKVARPEMNF